MTIAAHAEGTAIGLRMPPVPCAKAFCPKRKKGTSAPSDLPIGMSFFRGQFSPQSLLSPIRVLAQSLEPPPMPAPAGMRFFTRMRQPSVVPLACCRAHAKVFFHVSYDVARTCDFADRVKLQNDIVAQINQHEHGFKQMHAVGALPHYVQKKVEFGRSLEFERRSGHGYSMTRVRVICLGVLCESVTSAGEPSGLRRLTAICHPDCVKESSAT